MRRATRIVLSPEDWAHLHRWITDRHTASRIRRRARIVLGAAMGRSNREIARTLALDPATVSFWRQRFLREGLSGGLRDAPRPGRKRSHTVAASEKILHATLNVSPPAGERWTTRSLASFLGVNHMQVHRTWKAGGIRPAPVLPSEMMPPDPPAPTRGSEPADGAKIRRPPAEPPENLRTSDPPLDP